MKYAIALLAVAALALTVLPSCEALKGYKPKISASTEVGGIPVSISLGKKVSAKNPVKVNP